MGKLGFVKLANAGDFSGYIASYFFTLDYGSKPNITEIGGEVVDAIDGILLRHNLMNANNGKIQSGFDQIAVWKFKTNKVSTHRDIVDTLILEDGTIYQTYCNGWYNGDKSKYGAGSGATSFYNSFSGYNKDLPIDRDSYTWDGLRESLDGEFKTIRGNGRISPDISNIYPMYGDEKPVPIVIRDFEESWLSDDATKRSSWVDVVKSLSDILLHGTNIGWREDVTKKQSGCDWKVDLDGTKNPNILVKWTPQEGIQEFIDNGYYVHMSVGVIGITTGEPTNFSEFDIIDGTQGSITTTYNDLLLKAQHGDDIPDFIQKITNVFAKNNVELRFSLNYQKENENGEVSRENTSICYARFSYTGERISKGILEGQLDDGSTVEWGGSEEYNNDSADTSSDGYNDSKDDGTNDGKDFGDISDSAVSIYQLTSAQLTQFKNYLWGNEFIQDIKLVNSNPMENIVGIKRFPISAGISGSGSVVVGNVDTGVTANICKRTRTITKTISVPSHYNNFLDYAPYTSVSLYLPFVGVIEVDTNRVVGKSIEIKCSVDYVQGTCVYYLYDYKHCLLGQYSGICAIDSPVTGNNNAQVTSAYVMGGGSTAISLSTGNVLSATMTALSTAQVKHHYDTKGSFNSACLGGANQNIVLVIDYPMYQNLSKFNHTKGRKCNLSKKISDLKGYTVFNDSIDLTGVGGTREEIEELKNLMINGVYI